MLLNQSRRLWFFWDDFSFLLGRSLSHGTVSQLMVPHNEHWSFFPVISFRVMWAIFGMRHYLPYAVLPILLHVATAAALVVLVRRAGAGPWAAVLAGLVFAFLGGGAGAENPLWAFQIGFIGSCLAGVVALAFLDQEEPEATRPLRTGRWFWWGQAFLIVSLMCSGMGVPMVVVAAVWALIRTGRCQSLRRGLLAAVRVALLPVVVFAVWYVAWARPTFSSALADNRSTPGASVRSAVRGIGHVWSAAASLSWAGPVILVVLLVGVALLRSRGRLFALGAAGLVGLLFTYALVASGRSGTPTAIEASRYLYVGLVLCTPAVACVAEAFVARVRALSWAAAVGWVVVGALVIVIGSSQTASFAASRRAEDPGLRERLIAARTIVASGAPILNPLIDPYDHLPRPGLTVPAMDAAHGWSRLPAGTPSKEALFNERAVLQVGFQTSPMNVPPARSLAWQARGAPRIGTGCTTATVPVGRLLLVHLGARGGQVSLDLRGMQQYPRVLTWIQDRRRTSVSRFWLLPQAGGRYYAASSLTHGTLVVRLPASTVTVCPAGPGEVE